MQKKIVMALVFFLTLIAAGCAEKEMSINGMICPPNGVNEDRIQSDLRECRYYDMEAVAKASRAPITVECQKCLESKGYKIEP